MLFRNLSYGTILYQSRIFRGLVGKIIQRFEDRGYKLVALKQMTASKEHLEVIICTVVSFLNLVVVTFLRNWTGACPEFLLFNHI